MRVDQVAISLDLAAVDARIRSFKGASDLHKPSGGKFAEKRNSEGGFDDAIQRKRSSLRVGVTVNRAVFESDRVFMVTRAVVRHGGPRARRTRNLISKKALLLL